MPIPREGTLAVLRTLMGEPPSFRRGFTSADEQPNPAAGSGFTLTVAGDYWRRIKSVYFTFTPAATGTPREINLTYADGNGQLFDSVPIVPAAIAGKAYNCSADIGAYPGITPSGAQAGYGVQTAPAAGTVVASIGTVEPGQWEAQWQVELQGTLTALTDSDNFGLYLGSVLVAQSVNPAVVGVYTQDPVEFQALSAGSLTIKNIGAATAGSTYSAGGNVQAAGPSVIRARIPDVIMQPGWQFGIQIVNPTGTDQLSAINLLAEHYASDWASGTDAKAEDDILWQFAQVLSQG